MSDERERELERAARASPDDQAAWERWRSAAMRAGWDGRRHAARSIVVAAERCFTIRQRIARIDRVSQRSMADHERNYIVVLRDDCVGILRRRDRAFRRALLVYRGFYVADEMFAAGRCAADAGEPEAAALLTQVITANQHARPRRSQMDRGRFGRAQDPFTILSRSTERGITLETGRLMWAGRRAAETYRLAHGGRDPARMPEESAQGAFNVFCYPRTNDYLAMVDAAIDAEVRGDSRRGLGARRGAGRRLVAENDPRPFPQERQGRRRRYG